MKFTGILSLLFFLLSTSLFGQKNYEWPPKGEENTDYYLNSKVKPKPDGLHYRTYQNGFPYYAGMFKDGKPQPLTDMHYYSYEKEKLVTATHHFGKSSNEVNAENFFPSGKIKAQGIYVGQKRKVPGHSTTKKAGQKQSKNFI